jgi:hypothetical protein
MTCRCVVCQKSRLTTVLHLSKVKIKSLIFPRIRNQIQKYFRWFFRASGGIVHAGKANLSKSSLSVTSAEVGKGIILDISRSEVLHRLGMHLTPCLIYW